MGRSKKQTIGYRYFVGVHMTICHGPIDALLGIMVDEKELWRGRVTGATSGNATGTIVLTGNPTPISSTVRVDGNPFQFVSSSPGAGEILRGATREISATNLATAINALASVNATATGNVVTVVAAAAGPAGDAITMSKIEFFSRNIILSGGTLAGGGGGVIVDKPDLFGGEKREGGISGTLDFMPGGPSQGQNSYLVSVLGSLVPAFRGVVSVVLRQMYMSMNPYLKTWSFLVTRVHMQQDGEAQWQDSVSEITRPVTDAEGVVYQIPAMNPAHIVRECLTNRLWGMGYNPTDIDDVAFLAAAEALHTEGMGMCLLWDTQKSIEDFVKIVLQHIDGAIYVDRRTGKFVLKLIRGDYSVVGLLVLDPGNVDKLEDFKRPVFGELITSITVNYWNIADNKPASLTVQDIALEQEQGQGGNNTAVTYEGFIDQVTASRCAQRDLRTLSTPLISCTVYATKVARNLKVGDVFKLTWPDYQMAEVIMRITGIAYGNGKTRRVRINCIQDIFNYPEDAFVARPPSGWIDPGRRPDDPRYRVAFEMPYFQLVRDNGQSTIDAAIATNEYISYVGAAASRSLIPAVNGILHTDSGAGYEEVDEVQFCPAGELDGSLTKVSTTVNLLSAVDLNLVVVNEWLQIGQELMGIVSIAGLVVTVKRGVLDTTPALHATGAPVLFWSTFEAVDPTEYVSSDDVSVKITTINGSGSTDINEVAPLDLTLVGRAAKPYLPGQIQFNAAYYPTTEVTTAIDVTWSPRNRIIQTGGTLIGFVDAGVTVEPGVTYRIRVFDRDNALVVTYASLTGTAHTIPLAAFSALSERIFVELESVRAGLYSYQVFRHEITIPVSGESTEDGFAIETEGGVTLELEP